MEILAVHARLLCACTHLPNVALVDVSVFVWLLLIREGLKKKLEFSILASQRWKIPIWAKSAYRLWRYWPCTLALSVGAHCTCSLAKCCLNRSYYCCCYCSSVCWCNDVYDDATACMMMQQRVWWCNTDSCQPWSSRDTGTNPSRRAAPPSWSSYYCYYWWVEELFMI